MSTAFLASLFEKFDLNTLNWDCRSSVESCWALRIDNSKAWSVFTVYRLSILVYFSSDSVCKVWICSLNSLCWIFRSLIISSYLRQTSAILWLLTLFSVCNLWIIYSYRFYCPLQITLMSSMASLTTKFLLILSSLAWLFLSVCL